MSKEYLEAFRGFKNGMITDNAICITKSYFDNKFPVIEQALQRLEQIDNANPSEALKYLEDLRDYLLRDRVNISSTKNYNTIKQVLIKAQEQVKVFDMIKDIVKFGDDLNAILNFNTYEEYDEWSWDYYLSKEEFDLLKRYCG